MMRQTSSWLSLATTVALVSIGSSPTSAQDTGRGQGRGRLEGRVIEVNSGKPLSHVTITVIGTTLTTLSTKTTSSGSYRLQDVPVGTLRLRLELVGYASTVETATIGTEALTIADFSLSLVAHVLEEFIVQGKGERAPGTVDVNELAVGDLIQALDRGAPGALVYRPEGNLGVGATIVFRGLKSFTLRNDPLIFLDGVLMAEPNTVSRGQRGLTILELLEPEQIESIEVLTGPDATTRYGLGARNGVILIHTKR